MIFRVDDVSVNTDVNELIKMSEYLHSEYPKSEIWWCVNIFSKHAPSGSVYPDLPLKHRSREYFAEVDRMLPIVSVKHAYIKMVSHGLFHLDHSQCCLGMQLFSIVPSCRILKTDIFVPPFTKWNFETEKVCKDNGITLVKGYEEGWKSLEAEYFNPDYKKWFFHPWRIKSLDKLKERFNASKVN